MIIRLSSPFWLLLSILLVTPVLALDNHAIAVKYFGNDAPWYESRIPFFECSDAQLTDVYYYRWKIFRAHQRDLGAKGYISTEFLDDVGWQLEPWASLNDATGFHIGEGRWNRDRRYADDYINFMYNGGNDRHFTDYLADATYGRYLVDGDATSLKSYLGPMKTLYNQWADHFDTSKGLYYIEPLLDATEYTISSIDASGGVDGFTGGWAFRPSINAYMHANARAISFVATLSGSTADATDYSARAAAIKARVQADLWNSTLVHFIDRYQITNSYVSYYAPIRGRELVGYLPWTFGMADDKPEFARAWSHILSSNELAGSNGLRTVEPTYQYYMRQYRYEGTARECQWNGPVWPFQTTQVLLGLANLLDTYTQTVVTKGDYLRLLKQYAALHYQGTLLDLEEDYEPDNAGPIVGLARSHHYFHSGFIDLILSGLVGIRPRADDFIEVNPMLPDTATIPWFRVQNAPYHGHDVAVQWDATGSHYGLGAGMRVELDGVLIGTSPTLGRLRVAVPRKAVLTILKPIAKSIQLTRGQYPIANASSGTDTENVHDAIDGRVWFFPEAPHGWNSDAGTAAQWFSIDFGSAQSVSRAELAFFSDGTFVVPSAYALQRWDGASWVSITAQQDAPLANGITYASWTALSTSRIRVTLTQPSGKRIRLAEFKVY